MHVAQGNRIQEREQTLKNVERLESVYGQLGDPLAKSTGDAMKYLQMALEVNRENPRAAQNCIAAAQKALSQSEAALRGRSASSHNYEAYSAIMEDQTKAIAHFQNGDMRMASFLLGTANMNAAGIYDTLRVSGMIKGFEPSRDPQPRAEWSGDLAMSNAARLADIFKQAYERCTAAIAKAFADHQKAVAAEERKTKEADEHQRVQRIHQS